MVNLDNNSMQIVMGGAKYQLSSTCMCEIKNWGFGGYTTFCDDDDCATQCAELAKQQMRKTALVVAMIFGGIMYTIYK